MQIRKKGEAVVQDYQHAVFLRIFRLRMCGCSICVKLFGHCLDNMALYPDQWTTIVDATRNGAVRRLYFGYVDFSAFDNDAFQAVVRCSGLRSLLIRQSDVPSGLVLDSLIRSGAAMGLLQLRFTAAISDAPRSLSDDAVLDFFFRADTAPRPHEDFLYLEVTGSSVTDSFLTKFFEVITFVVRVFFNIGEVPSFILMHIMDI